MFSIEKVVEFADTDMAGIVHFPNFFHYMEYAESEFLKTFGLSLFDRADAYAWPRCQAHCQYLEPVKYNDYIKIELVIQRVGRSSVEYKFLFSVEGKKVAEGGYLVVYTSIDSETGTKKSQPIPKLFKDKIQSNIAEGESN